MTKRPPARTRPLDRDGDGNDGGSLPGNTTAPMTGETVADPAPTEAETVTDPIPSDPETVTDPAPTEAGTVTPPDTWTRKNDEILEDLQLVDEGWPGTADTLTLDVVAGWTDDQARQAQAWAIAKEAGGTLTPPEWVAPFLLKANEDESVDAEAPETDPAKLAAIEAEVDAANAEARTDVEDPAVAVRRDELQRLVDNRWLYKTAEGYSPGYTAPFIAPATIALWIEQGLAEDSPSAGREGGVVPTALARRHLTGLRADADEPGINAGGV